MFALVTGATGFIGSHLARALAGRGARVRALVRSPAAAEGLAAAGIELVRGDLGEPASLAGIGEGITHVFHAAAQLNLNLPNATADDFRTNASGTEALVNALKGPKITRFVHISSLAAIGIRPAGKIDESFPCDPDLHYGKSKLAADLHLLALHRERGLPVVILRPPTVYGPGERYNFLAMCRAIRSGAFVHIGRGDNRVDFLSIGNLVQALILAAERGRPGEIYLVADQPPLPFRETVDVVARIVRGRPLARVHVPVPLAYAIARPLEALGKRLNRAVPLYPARVRTMSGDLCFDVTKAERELGYAPEGPFARLVRPAIEWYWEEGLLARPASARVGRT